MLVLKPVAVTVTVKSPLVAELQVSVPEPEGKVRSTEAGAIVQGPGVTV